MRCLLLFVLIIEIVHSTCPGGFELVRDGQCRGKYATIMMPWTEAPSTAITKCKEINAQPVIIHNEEDNEYWADQDPSWILIGLICNPSSSRWEWADGSAIDYKPAAGQYNTDLDKACTQQNGCSWDLTAKGVWEYICGNTKVYDVDIFCTTQLQQPVDDICDSFEDDVEDAVCYQIGTNADSWQDAQMICRHLGANLASIHNVQENSFVRRLAVSKGAVNGVFLGASISGKGKEFGWIDGTDWDYQNFYPGFPMSGSGDCLAMDTSTSTGQWMNIDCSAELPVVCMREQKAIDTDPTCETDPWVEESIITSPGFPYTATLPCDYFFTVDAGERVEAEIIFLEANTCCDSLIIYDGFLGGHVIANLTGEVRNATFTTTVNNPMRVSWEPKGGVNVRGMAMTFRVI